MYKRQSLWSEQFGLEFMLNEEHSIQVDHSAKSVVVAARPPQAEGLPNTFEAYLELYQSATVHQQGQHDVLRLDFSDYVLYDYAEVWLDPATSIPARMVVWSKANDDQQRARMELTYESLDLSPQFGKNSFASSRYIRKKGAEYATAAAFSNYQLEHSFTD